MDFAGGMCVYPGGGVDPRDFDAAVGWAGPDARRVGRAAGLRRGDRAGAGVRRRARDVRGVRRAAGRHVRVDRRRRHHRRRLGGRPGRAGVARAVDDRLPEPARAGAAHRPARRLGRLADPDLRAEALPHLVLRRAAARGAGDPRRVDASRRRSTWLPARRRRRAGRRGRAGADAADVPHLDGGRRARPRRRRCSRWPPRARSRCSRRRSSRSATGWTLSMPDRLRPLVAARRRA